VRRDVEAAVRPALEGRDPDRRSGERLTGEVVDYVQQLAVAAVMVEGAVDESLPEFRVVR